MIEGVARNSAPRIILTVHGEDDSEDIEFLIDTGCTGFLSLPTSTLDALGAEEEGAAFVSMADGSYRRAMLYRVNVEWNGDEREVQAITLEDQPLLGFQMMQGYHLSIEMSEGGLATMEEM